MKEICNIKEFSNNGNLPSVKEAMSNTEIVAKNKVLQYLKSFNADCAAGMSLVDEVTGETLKSGVNGYNDGEYFWDTRHIYHFEKYNMKLNDDFIKYVLSQ